MARVRVSLLSSLLVLPALFAFFILHCLVIRQLGLVELILQQGLLMNLPAMLESVDCHNHIVLDRFSPLQRLALQSNRPGLEYAQVPVPVVALTSEALVQIERAILLH